MINLRSLQLRRLLSLNFLNTVKRSVVDMMNSELLSVVNNFSPWCKNWQTTRAPLNSDQNQRTTFNSEQWEQFQQNDPKWLLKWLQSPLHLKIPRQYFQKHVKRRHRWIADTLVRLHRHPLLGGFTVVEGAHGKVWY